MKKESIRNKDCADFPEVCYLCGNCNKHHNCKDGADKCCTNKVSRKCGCRHCFYPNNY